MGIFKKGGDWWIDYYVSGRGTRKREKIGPSKRLALAVLAKRRTQVAERRHLDVKRNEKITLLDFGREFIDVYSRPNKRSWRSSDENSYRAIVPHLGNFFLYEITPDMIERYKVERLKTLKPSSVNRELAFLKTMFNKAVEWKRLAQSPMATVKLLKESNDRFRWLSKAEIGLLLGACSSRLRPIIVTAINTGLRKGDIQRLEWRNIDFQRCEINAYVSKAGKTAYDPAYGYAAAHAWRHTAEAGLAVCLLQI